MNTSRNAPRFEHNMDQIDILDELDSIKENVPPNLLDSYKAHRLRILRMYAEIGLSSATYDAFDRCGHEIDVFNDTTCMSDLEDFVDDDAEFEQRDPVSPLYTLLDEISASGIKVDENGLSYAFEDFESIWLKETRVSTFRISDHMQAYRDRLGWKRSSVSPVTKHLWVLAADTLRSIFLDKTEESSIHLVNSIITHGNRLFK